MASLSGVNAPHEVSLFIDFCLVWDTYVRVRVGNLPPYSHRDNACRAWRIPDVDSAKRSPGAPPILIVLFITFGFETF